MHTPTDMSGIGQQDAHRRVQELQAVRAELLPDADDPRVMSELTSIEDQLAAAQHATTKEPQG